MSSYTDMKDRHTKDIDDFPMFFAFNTEQFKEGMKGLGLEETDTKKVCTIPAGGIIKKEDSKRFIELMNSHTSEKKEAIKADKTGDRDGFIFGMFNYELGNHEFCYTGDIQDTLNAVGISQKEIDENPALHNGLDLAITMNWEQR